MNDKELRLYNYVNMLYIDYLFFSDNIDEILENESKDAFFNLIFVSSLSFKLNDLLENQYYPIKCIKNLEKIINYLNVSYFDYKTIDEQIFCNKIIKLLNKRFKSIKDKEATNQIYSYEYMMKFGTLENLKKMNSNELEIDVNEIEESIIFDYKVIRLLLEKDFIEDDFSNENYLYSIKKFLSDFPEMFLDKEINERALYILNKQCNKESKVLIFKLKNINKYQKKTNFKYVEFLALYDHILFQNVSLGNKCEVDYKKVIENKSLVTLYSFIDKEMIYDKNAHKNLRNFMFNCLEYVRENKVIEELKQFLIEYNIYLGKLNTYENYNFREYIDSELLFRYGFIKSSFKILFNYNDKLQQEIANKVKDDLDILNLYYLDEEDYIKEKETLKDKEIYTSIKKISMILPTIFDDFTINTRTIDMLEISDIKKSENKKLIKAIKKKHGDMNDIK